jgi:transposase
MSAAVKITQTEHTAAELRGFAARSRDTAQSRRLLAIAMVLDAATRLEAARQTGMDRQTLRDWVHRYNETEIAGLLSRLAPGPTPKLTEAQMAELRELVVAGPDPEKHQVVRWRCADVRVEVTRRFSVTVPERTISKWLRKPELTRLQPRPYHPRKDAAADGTRQPQRHRIPVWRDLPRARGGRRDDHACGQYRVHEPASEGDQRLGQSGCLCRAGLRWRWLASARRGTPTAGQHRHDNAATLLTELMENVWAYLRANKLCALVWDSYDAILEACKDAWTFLVNDPDRIRSIGSRYWATVSG